MSRHGGRPRICAARALEGGDLVNSGSVAVSGKRADFINETPPSTVPQRVLFGRTRLMLTRSRFHLERSSAFSGGSLPGAVGRRAPVIAIIRSPRCGSCRDELGADRFEGGVGRRTGETDRLSTQGSRWKNVL